MSEPIYTQPQIEEAWGEYTTKQVLKVLKDGKWKFFDVGSTHPDEIDGTRAEMVGIKTVMSFPKYLQKHYRS